MKKILAVSGGVDSVVMLDLLARGAQDELIVAHFDHGTRASSRADAEFVRGLAGEYGLEFITERAELGEGVSEAAARRARYDFLRRVAGEDGVICTAHHMDDAIETVAINLLRGTGWRGLAAMGDGRVQRPLLEKGWRKRDVWRYAGEWGLHFRQDPTNNEIQYLRNRVREKLAEINDGDMQKLAELFRRQKAVRAEIDELVAGVLPKNGMYQRRWFVGLDDGVALEILRAGLLAAGVKMTRPQLEDFLAAVREYQPEKEFNLPGGRLVKIHKTYYNIL